MSKLIVATVTVYEDGTTVSYVDHVNDASLADVLREVADRVEAGGHRADSEVLTLPDPDE